MIVFTTVSDKQSAQNIARTLVQEGLCACVSEIPNLTSYYIYNGEFCEEPEILLMIKTAPSHYDVLEKRLLELHPYETPEIISTRIEKALPAYQEWLSSRLGPL